MSRGLAGAIAWAALAGALAAPARAEEPDAATPVEAVLGKEVAVEAVAATKETLARRQAFAAYRLARLRALEPLSPPAERLARVQAVNFAALGLRRNAEEATLLRQEVARLRADREALERAVVAAVAPTAWDENGPPGAADAKPEAPPAMMPPADGTRVATAGPRKDGATGVMLRRAGLEILGRFGTPVRAPLAGRVARVEPLPHGGHAVVLAHADRWVSIVAGLREVRVTRGAEVETGEEIGAVGRTLDGAPVVTFELWHAGAAVDPAPVFARRARAAAQAAGSRP